MYACTSEFGGKCALWNHHYNLTATLKSLLSPLNVLLPFMISMLYIKSTPLASFYTHNTGQSPLVYAFLLTSFLYLAFILLLKNFRCSIFEWHIFLGPWWPDTSLRVALFTHWFSILLTYILISMHHIGSCSAYTLILARRFFTYLFINSFIEPIKSPYLKAFFFPYRVNHQDQGVHNPQSLTHSHGRSRHRYSQSSCILDALGTGRALPPGPVNGYPPWESSFGPREYTETHTSYTVSPAGNNRYGVHF